MTSPSMTPSPVKTCILDQISEEHIAIAGPKFRAGASSRSGKRSNDRVVSVSRESFTTGAVFDLSGGRATY